MSHGEILGESELWQELNRALMTCCQGRHWLTNGAEVFFSADLQRGEGQEDGPSDL